MRIYSMEMNKSNVSAALAALIIISASAWGAPGGDGPPAYMNAEWDAWEWEDEREKKK